MSERPRFFDDLAGVAGGAISALAGLREEAEALVRARIDEAIRAARPGRREELDAVAEMAANARAGQEAAEAQSARGSPLSGWPRWKCGYPRWKRKKDVACRLAARACVGFGRLRIPGLITSRANP